MAKKRTSPSAKRFDRFKRLKQIVKVTMRANGHQPGKPSRETDPNGFLIYYSDFTCKRCGMTAGADAEDGKIGGKALSEECAHATTT
jgi:hypothetical protein